MSNRQSWVGVEGGFGTVNLGRVYTEHHMNQAAGDMLGNFNNAAGYIGGMDSQVRLSNSISYISPSFSGFGLSAQKGYGETLQYSGNAKRDGVAATVALNNKKENETTGIRLKYANGPIAAGLAFEEVKNAVNPNTTNIGNLNSAAAAATTVTGQTLLEGGALNADKQNKRSLSASYDFGVAKVGFVNNDTKFKTAGDPDLKWSANTFSVAAPLGAVTLMGSVGNGKFKQTGEPNTKVTAYQVAASYALSKRTDVYAIIGESKFKTTEAGVTDQAKFNSTAVGVRHTF